MFSHSICQEKVVVEEVTDPVDIVCRRRPLQYLKIVAVCRPFHPPLLRDVARCSGRVDGSRRGGRVSSLLLQPARPPPESVGRASGQRRRGSLSLLCLSLRDCLRKGRKRGGMFSRFPRRVRLRWNFDRTLLRTMAQLIVPDAGKDAGSVAPDLESQKMLQSDPE